MQRHLAQGPGVADRFRDIAGRFGSEPALVWDGQDGESVLSYADVDRASDALALSLVAAGAAPGDLIGIAPMKGGPGAAQTVIGLIAILKAGAGYVPLPDSYPPELLRAMLSDAGVTLALVPAAIAPGGANPAASAGLGVLRIDLPAPGAAALAAPGSLPSGLATARSGGRDAAYVMFTSGSTGVPKGVIVPHRAILRLVVEPDFMTLGPEVRILHYAPLAFDASTLEIWGALLNGGTLVLPPEGQLSLRDLGELIARARVTTLWLTAGLFHAMADSRPADFAPLRELLTGGDVVSPAAVARVRAACPGLRIINGYGPTENTTFTTCHTITEGDLASGAPLPIGRAIRGTEVHVVDETLHPVPPGTEGELCASGEGLATGYLGRPDLTQEKFVEAPWMPGLRLYRTGDLVRMDEDGVVRFLGRIDTQVKIRGYRIELAGIEAAMEACPGVAQAVVVARPGADGADKTLVGYYLPAPGMNPALLAHALRRRLAEHLPDHSRPRHLVALDSLPLNANGKVDRRALTDRPLASGQTVTPADPPAAAAPADAVAPLAASMIEEQLAAGLAEILGAPAAGLDRMANFFDLGASSLAIARLHERLEKSLGKVFPITDFFLHSTIRSMARHLAGEGKGPLAAGAPSGPAPGQPQSEGLIAIVGLAGRFPGAPSAEAFWQALVEGRELISQFTPEELDIDPSRSDPGAPYVRARGVMPGADLFDARHFGVPPREAERMDPQHRILLEVAQTALENAGVDPDRYDGHIGIFAGSSQNSYLLNNLLSAPGAPRALAAGYPVKDFATLFGNDKDFIVTRVAYKLNLRGPAMTVLCACSTSLVAVAQACESLRRGTSDVALAGGVSVTFPSKRPYLYTPDGMASADGHCRTFDAEATGTVFGDGCGLVVLKRLEDARRDGDEIIAVIRGYSINNDGSDKAGYAAPSIRAQAEVIRAAHRAARVSPDEIGYVEAHGTGTPLGDPIEFAALSDAFAGSAEGHVALGTAKTNVGHLDIAAGVTGLIKTALTLKHGVIPPILHFTRPNPRISFDGSAFRPVTSLTEWPRGDAPRRAGVSAFGVGGTNIHMVLEEAPASAVAPAVVPDAATVLPVSASSDEALAAAIRDLGAWAAANPGTPVADIAATLRHGRRQYAQRAALVASSATDLARVAAGHPGKGVTAGSARKVAFLFPGQGAQHVGMGRELFAAEPVFREALSLCARLLEPELGLNLIDIIHAPEDRAEEMTERLKNTALAQPAIFSMAYALAKQWAHWGVAPDAMAGHSIGEFAAACLAGVIDLPDALKLIALRGRLMAGLPGGVMMSVRASEAEVAPFLTGMDLAAVNGAKAVVIAGPTEAADAIEPELAAAGFVTSRLHTSHAFHSRMMDPVVDRFRAAVAQVTLRAPQMPILSTVTGDWLTAAEATDPGYWAGHMRKPVRFYEAAQQFWARGDHVFLEAGPGRTLSVLAGQNPDRARMTATVASLPHAQAEDRDSHRAMLGAFGALWAAGLPVDWARLGPESQRRASLPTYPFQRKRFWVEPQVTDEALPVDAAALAPQTVVPAGEPGVTAAELPGGAADDLPAQIRAMLADLSGLDAAEIAPDVSFLALGFDSLLLTQATREISDRFGVSVSLRELIDGLPTVDALAAHIAATGPKRGAKAAPAPAPAPAPLAEAAKPASDAVAAPSSAPVTRIDREAKEITPRQRAHIDRLVARYTARTPKSKELTAKYRPTHADPRTASGFNRLWKEIVYQIVTVKSRGSRLLDVDGNEYIDILNGFGPGFLGHSHPAVVEAIETQLHEGYEVGPQSLAAMEASELFCRMTGNDRASFVCTGSEAVYAAMRLARTVTQRDRIVMFARDYHGNFDEVLVRGIDGKDGPRTLPLAPGIPRDAVKNVIVLPYGTPQALDWIRSNADTLAAVIVEPVQSRRPEFRPADFIREVRRITEASGALFIFDEVVTGFRFGPRGAQGYYGVDADLVTYGKVVGGGMPVGVVSGKARYMDTFDGGQWQYGDDSFPQAPVTFFAGTFVRHPLAMASLRAMLRHLEKQPAFFWQSISLKGDRLAGTVDRWFAENDMPFQMPNCGSLMYLRIGEDQPYGALLGAHMRDRGVFLLEGFPSYMTAAHDDEDIDHVIAAFQDSALEMRADGMLAGREAVEPHVPAVHAAPPRLTLPRGEAKIVAAMTAPLAPVSVPTTEAQREIWAAMVVTPEIARAYNESVTLRMTGPVDCELLLRAVHDGLMRHDAFRATFSEDGATMTIAPDAGAWGGLPVDFVDLSPARDRDSALAAVRRAEVETGFDMARGPFVRAKLVALGRDEAGEERHDLLITAHHIVCDGWSIDVVMRDIGALYTAAVEGRAPNLPPAQSIIDYARAEADWARTPAARETEAYWLERFREMPPALDLPTDRPHPVRRTGRGARHDHALSPDLVARLRQFARAKGTTFVSLLLAGWNLHLARVSKGEDMVVGMPVSGQAARGMPGVVGHCASLLPIRSRIDWKAGFDAYLGEVRRSLLDAFDHQGYTYGSLMRALKVKRDSNRVQLVPVIFNFDKGIDLSTMSFGQARTEFVSNPRAYELFDLYLNVTDAGERVITEWAYDTDLFDAPTIARHAAQFEALLDGLTRDTGVPLSAIGGLVAGPARPASGTHDDPGAAGPQLVTEIFRDVARRFAGRTALSYLGETMDYATLDARSDALAAELAARGVRRGHLVGITSERSLNLIVAVLGVLKAGAGYVPFDTTLPAERLSFMARDTGIRVLIGSCVPVAEAGVSEIAFGRLPHAVAPGLTVPPGPASGDDICYVMFTSGTTGVPKGVVLPHRSVVRMLVDTDWIDLGPDTVTLHSSAFAFDTSIIDIFGALLHGGTVVIPKDGVLSIADLAAAIAGDAGGPAVNTLWLTSGLFHAVADSRPEAFAGVAQVIVGGDIVSPAHAGRVMDACPAVKVINGYGPTESNVTNAHLITREDIASGQSIPIGRAIPGTQIYILDEAGSPVPAGMMGELAIAGRGLALGYWNRPELTAEKFITAPWDDRITIYRSGDLAMDPGDGVIRFFGRIDTQVKVRGFRVELSEVEAAVESHPGVARVCVVALVPEGQADKVLVAYVVPQGTPPSRRALAEHVKTRLPPFARPSHFVMLAELPLNPNGKVDRRALPPLTSDMLDTGSAQAETETEKALTPIWAEVLGVKAPGVEADFFEMGGHSLLAVKLFARIRKRFGIDMPISTLFQNPTVRDLAQAIDASLAPKRGMPAARQEAGTNVLPLKPAMRTAVTGDPLPAPRPAPPRAADRTGEPEWDTTTVINPGPGTGQRPLFIVGGVGGNVNNLYHLGAILGRARPVIGFQTRGIMGHRPRDTIEEIAAEHIRYMRRHQAQGPYLLSGYSGGALTAFEMARQLTAAGEKVGWLGILDTAAPGFFERLQIPLMGRVNYAASALRRRGLFELWRRGQPWLRDRLLTDAVITALGPLAAPKLKLLKLARHWMKAANRYSPGPFGGDAWLILTPPDSRQEELLLAEQPYCGWERFVTGQLHLTVAPADHISILTGDHALWLADWIETGIAEARAGGGRINGAAE